MTAPFDDRDADLPLALPGGEVPFYEARLVSEERADPPWALPEPLPSAVRVEGESLPAALPAPRKPHPAFWWSVLWCLGFLAVTQIFPGVVITVLVIVVQVARSPQANEALLQFGSRNGQADLMHLILMPFVAASTTLGALVSLLAIRLVNGRDWTRKIALRRPSLVHLAIVLLAFPALPIAASGVYQVAKNLLPSTPELLRKLTARPAVVLGAVPADQRDESPDYGMEQVVQEARSWPPFLAVLLIGLGPGISEELWCRGFLGRGLVGKHGFVGGILLTSLFFGVIHMDLPQGIMAACMGVVLHYAYVMTRSLFVPMLLHFLNNSLAVIGDRISPELGKVDTDPNAIPGLLYVWSILVLAAAGYALYRGRARLALAPGEPGPAWRPDFPSVEYPPRGSGTVVIRPWPGWLACLLVALSVAGLIGTFIVMANRAA